MKIRVIGHGGEPKFPFGTSGPWKEFERVFLSRGHQICGPDMAEGADALITNSYNQSVGTYLENHRISRNRRILVLWEPYAVETIRYKNEVLSRFGTTFAPSIDWAEKVGATPFNWPQDEIPDSNVFINWRERSHRAVMVQGNKFSARRGELYSLRRKVIIKLGIGYLDLFGTNWNKGINFDWWRWSRSVLNSRINEVNIKSAFGIGKKYRNYLGVTEDKNKTLYMYKIAVVIENSADFVSEKLFDSVRAGCVTVYVGPSLEKYGIPNSSAIQVNANVEAISSTVKQLLEKSEESLEKIALNQRRSLMKVSHEWNNSIVLTKLASDMVDILESN
jgi:hypothetical protein